MKELQPLWSEFEHAIKDKARKVYNKMEKRQYKLKIGTVDVIAEPKVYTGYQDSKDDIISCITYTEGMGDINLDIWVNIADSRSPAMTAIILDKLWEQLGD